MTDFHETSREAWDTNADFWDQRMAEGNDFQRLLVAPATSRLLNAQAGELILDAACGNGVMARRLAQLGARILAFDFAPRMVEAARARGDAGGAIDYHVIDGTDRVAITALGRSRFDAAVCNMALMDMAEIQPLFDAMPEVLKPGGRMVFSLSHPCFNHSGCARQLEETDEGGVVTRHSVRVFRYRSARPSMGIAMTGQPALQVYFDRTLSDLFAACFRAGMVITGIEEPVFPLDDSPPTWNHTGLFQEIPPVLAVRAEVR
jgi:2-polyprenyl-3-methyl-5-hydroxy-6-metoxy-1,4-benzoquinol methylase